MLPQLLTSVSDRQEKLVGWQKITEEAPPHHVHGGGEGLWIGSPEPIWHQQQQRLLIGDRIATGNLNPSFSIEHGVQTL